MSFPQPAEGSASSHVAVVVDPPPQETGATDKGLEAYGNYQLPAVHPPPPPYLLDASNPARSKRFCLRRFVRKSVRLIPAVMMFSLFVVWVHGLTCLMPSNHAEDGTQTEFDTLVSLRPVYPIQQRILNTNFVPFVQFPDRLQQTLNATYVHQLLEKVNEDSRLKEPLQPLSNAFVRVVTPAEFHVLNEKGVTIEQINDVALNHYIAYTQYYIRCLAVTRVEGDVAIYVRVYSRQWDEMRKDIARIFYNLGGDKDAFHPEDFNPHITVGHTHPGVLHDDGVALHDSRHQCWADLRLAGPRF